jgi:hypothetical protein
MSKAVMSAIELVIKFLRDFAPDGPWLVFAKDPSREDSPMLAKFCTDIRQATKFLAAHWTFNLYFQICVPPAPFPDKKPKRAHIVESRWLWFECDINDDVPIEELPAVKAEIVEHVLGLGLEPDLIIDSGHGLWFDFQIEPTTDLDSVEAANKALIDRVNASIEGRRWKADKSVWNADRCARLPYTTNYPTPRKLERGRSPDPLPALVIEHNPGRPPGRLEDYKPKPMLHRRNGNGTRPKSASVVTSDLPRLESIDALDEFDVRKFTKGVIEYGKDFDGNPHGFPSRSEAVRYVSCELVRRQVPRERIAGIFLDERFRISDSVRKRSDAVRYAWRQVERAEAEAEGFQETAKGGIRSNLHNVRLALDRMNCEVRYDQFANRVRVDDETLDDKLLTQLWGDIETKFGWCRRVKKLARTPTPWIISVPGAVLSILGRTPQPCAGRLVGAWRLQSVRLHLCRSQKLETVAFRRRSG